MDHAIRRGATALVIGLLIAGFLASSAYAGSAAHKTKRGTSGQVYTWHAGSC